MITDQLNAGLINLMKEKIPEGANLANILMDTLFLGREAVYRRLRGEVPFTFSEAAVISKKLGISLDMLIGSNFQGSVLFSLNLIDRKDPYGSLFEALEYGVKMYGDLAREPESFLCTASNIIPPIYYMRYPQLLQFQLFKMMYQQDETGISHKSYDDFAVPKSVIAKVGELNEQFLLIEKSCYLWDADIYKNWVDDIRYFSNIHLISEENIRAIQAELLLLVNEMEQFATTGKLPSGKKVEIYISNIQFESTYSFITTRYRQLSWISLYSMNSMFSADSDMPQHLKEWIGSLRKFSTLISMSGEMQRIRFFKEQRKIIQDLTVGI